MGQDHLKNSLRRPHSGGRPHRCGIGGTGAPFLRGSSSYLRGSITRIPSGRPWTVSRPGSFSPITRFPASTGSRPSRWPWKKPRACPLFLSPGALGEERAIDLIKSGATDFVLKDRLSRLPLCVKRALDEVEEKRRRQQAEEECARLAAAVEQASESTIMVNSRLVIEYVNPAFESINGHKQGGSDRKDLLLTSWAHPRMKACGMLFVRASIGKGRLTKKKKRRKGLRTGSGYFPGEEQFRRKSSTT